MKTNNASGVICTEPTEGMCFINFHYISVYGRGIIEVKLKLQINLSKSDYCFN